MTLFRLGLVVVIIPLVSSEDFYRPGFVEHKPSLYSEKTFQEFGQYLSELVPKMSDPPTDIQQTDLSRELFKDDRNATALGSDRSFRSRLSRCKKAGYWAYILTCAPRNQCGGQREIQFLHYVSRYCNAVFPDGLLKKLDVKEVLASCEELQLDQKQIGTSRRQNKELVLIAVEGASRPIVPRNLQLDSTQLLKVCRKYGRTRCNEACRTSYRTLCSRDYTCLDDVMADFAVNCYRACRYYFGGS